MEQKDEHQKSNFSYNLLTIRTRYSNGYCIRDRNLTIKIQGLHSDQGQAIFVLMDSESSHKGTTPIFSKKLIPIVQHSAEATFPEIPAGEYSAVVYHDVNGNGELDRYFFGLPKEPYGFSNDVRNPIGFPGFDESRFKVSTSESHHTITVK